MGLCCSKPGEQLPACTDDEIKKLKEKNHLPCLAVPSVDLEGDNHMQTVYVAEYENGTELTFLFLDEDRPNKCEDCFYDTIRRPLFGRWSDIESIIIINDTVEFPGTYSGEQVWNTKVPKHGHASVDLADFERKTDDNEEFVLFVNTWNHLLSEKNNNTERELTFCRVHPAGVTENTDCGNFVLRRGSRAEVDARFKGCLTSVADVMTPEREEKLGKRLF